MDRDALRELLKQLHHALGGERAVDKESRHLLGTVMEDIERVLQQPAAVADEPVSGRLDQLVVRYEADHPAVAGAMRQLIDALAKAGI